MQRLMARLLLAHDRLGDPGQMTQQLLRSIALHPDGATVGSASITPSSVPPIPGLVAG